MTGGTAMAAGAGEGHDDGWSELDRVARALSQHVPVRITDAREESRHAAVALVLRERSPGDPLELLFIQRAVYPGDPWSGQVAFPGGRRDPDDPHLVHTAMREVEEELGLSLDGRARLLGALDEIHPRTPVLPPIIVRPYVFAVNGEVEVTPNAEVAAAFWVPLSVLRDPSTEKESTVEVRTARWRVPSYVIEEQVVWGMTERILRQFLAVTG